MSLTRIQPSGIDQTKDYAVDLLTANTVVAGGVDLYAFANAAFGVANTAPTSGSVTAAFDAANTASVLGTSAYGQANTATTLASAAFSAGNTTNTLTLSAYGKANTNTILATAAYGQANTGTTLATAAFGRANNSLNVASGGTVTGATSFEGSVTFQETSDVLQTGTVSATTSYDMSLGNVFYHSSVAAAANWTANFTNVATTDNRTVVATIVVSQGATAYIPNAVQIGGSAQTINWVNGATPTGSSNKKDIFSFSLLRTGAAWIVLGQAASYG